MSFCQNIVFIPESVFKHDCSPSDCESTGRVRGNLSIWGLLHCISKPREIICSLLLSYLAVPTDTSQCCRASPHQDQGAGIYLEPSTDSVPSSHPSFSCFSPLPLTPCTRTQCSLYPLLSKFNLLKTANAIRGGRGAFLLQFTANCTSSASSRAYTREDEAGGKSRAL